MDESVLQMIITAFVAIPSGVVLHEASHYVVGRLFSRNVSLAFDGITPNIQFNSPDEINDMAIRFSGIAPYLVGTVIILAAILTGLNLTGFYLVIVGAIMVVSASGGDLLAVFAPDEFREYARTTDSEVPVFREAIRTIQ